VGIVSILMDGPGKGTLSSANPAPGRHPARIVKKNVAEMRFNLFMG
jgi:hypothetical protein